MAGVKQVNIFAAFIILLLGLVVDARAIDVAVSSDFVALESKANVAGGMSYLPDGDILAVTSDFVNAPKLYRFDANGDGVPLGGEKELAKLDLFAFANFVRVSPSGSFALVGLSGSSSEILRVDLATDTVSSYFSEPGNFDLAFIDDQRAYLSSNPGGFNPAVPNRISFVELNGAPSPKTVLEIANTPSGPVAVNTAGDLYYIKGTFTFPPPAGSSHLLKFTAASLASALVGNIVLGEVDAQSDVLLDGGYNLVFHDLAGNGGELFVSTIGNQILRLLEGSTTADVFLTVVDPNNPISTPSLTAMSFFEPLGRFDASGPAQSILGVSVATNFFSDFSLLQVKPKTFDADGDNTADSSDECPLDVAKVSSGVCGCGNEEVDSNGDTVVDCGSTRQFSSSLRPLFGDLLVKGSSLRLKLEKLANERSQYRIELTKLGKNGETKIYNSSSSSVRVRELKSGRYKIRYAIINKGKKRSVRSKLSASQTVTID